MADIHAQINALTPSPEGCDVIGLYVRFVRPGDAGSPLDSAEVGDALNTLLAGAATVAGGSVLAFDIASCSVCIDGHDNTEVSVSRSLADFAPEVPAP